MNDQEIKRRYLELKREQLRRIYPKLWLAQYHHLNVHNKKMRFDDKYRFLVQLYQHFDPLEAIEKCVQSGLSERLIVATIDEAMQGLRVLYVMPNYELRNKFVKDRFDRLLKTVPFYSNQLKEAVVQTDSVGMKFFGKGVMNFVGSNSPGDFISYPADVLHVDEEDDCDQINLQSATDRLDHSDYKYDRRIGNPSVENWGIDRTYQESSQALWIMKCPHCNTYQTPDFFSNMVIKTGNTTFDILGDREDENSLFVCKKCHKPFNRYGDGEWIHKFPDVLRKGRRINQIFSANVTLLSLLDAWKKAQGNSLKTQLFYNRKMGLPYSDSGSKITFDLLEKSRMKSNYTFADIVYNKYRKIHVGIDVGNYYHVIVRAKLDSGIRKLLLATEIETTKQLVDLIRKISPFGKGVMIDHGPEIKEVENLKRIFKGMKSCEFIEGKTLLGLKQSGDKFTKERKVQIDRTFLLDSAKGDFANNLMMNPSNAFDIGNDDQEEYGRYYQQMMASTRVFDEKRGKFVWRESGPDHYFLAESYCKMAELIDPDVFMFYENKVKEFEGKTIQEVEREEEKKKRGDLFPKGEDGKLDIEKMKVLNANDFLRNLYIHNEDIMKGKKDEDE